jgi:hypothetical protein
MQIHVNQLKFEGEDAWTIQFNRCSDLFAKANDPNLSKEEQDKYWEEWRDERMKLEMGNY